MKVKFSKIRAQILPNKYILQLAFIAFLLGGCSKLETIPSDRLSNVLYWRTENDAELATNAIYRFLEGTNIFIWDGVSDIGHTNTVYSTIANIENGEYDALNDEVFSEWYNAYKGISGANSFLENVQKVTVTNQIHIDRLIAEVKVLRAYQYIRLASLYGDVPLVTTKIDLAEGVDLTRAPVAQVWDFIEQELTDASGALPPTQAEKGRITKGAALALKARAMLYAGRYEEAAVAAKQVMDLNVYIIYPSYKNLFTYVAENNNEVILDHQYIKDNYSNNVFSLMAPYSQQCSNIYVPTKKLIDSYQMSNGKEITDPTSGFDSYNPYNNRDPRLKYSFYLLGDTLPNGTVYDPRPGSGTNDDFYYSFLATSTGFNLKKYINKEDLIQKNNCGINIILIRYAEVLLTYAEAKVEMNQIDQSVIDAINEVRQRPDVNMPLITNISSQNELRDIVRRERMVELAFEGLRYFDVRRWRIAENVLTGTVFGATYEVNGILKTVEVNGFEKRFDEKRDYLWPIPQKERELNKNLTNNPGW